jgi:Protein of unknown function (DUF3253)
MGRTPERADKPLIKPAEDARWIVVNGRRWRATDPAIEPRFRAELVAELMAARRAVQQSRRDRDRDAETQARGRVHRAKVALGERGEPWWEEASESGQRERLAAVALALASHRAPDRTICPSDIARAIGGPSWRSLLDQVRQVVSTLAQEESVEILQKGKRVDPLRPWRGPIRIRARVREASSRSTHVASPETVGDDADPVT